MRRSFLLLAVVAGLSVALAAQQEQRRNYDPATEVTITGVVEEVVEVAHQGRGTGTHLKLKTDAGVVVVHVGPTRFLISQKASFFKGDQITVTGSKVKNAVIAREIKKGDATLTLRDAQGEPKWSRGGARPS